MKYSQAEQESKSGSPYFSHQNQKKWKNTPGMSYNIYSMSDPFGKAAKYEKSWE